MQNKEKVRVILCLMSFCYLFPAVRNDGFQLRVEEELINNHCCK